jgi:hypothetical protein
MKFESLVEFKNGIDCNWKLIGREIE